MKKTGIVILNFTGALKGVKMEWVQMKRMKILS